MKYFNTLIISFTLVIFGCELCEEVNTEPCGQSALPNSEYCGWTVSTCFGTSHTSGVNVQIDPDAPVAVIYDTRDIQNAPLGTDWGTTVPTIHPPTWTSKNLGQIFGIALDREDNIYFASSDIYVFDDGWTVRNCESGNTSRPYGCGTVFKCSPPSWQPEVFADLPNSCDILNGLGNIIYDKWNNQFFVTNLEDGKIYQISNSGDVVNTYDPWQPDNGVAGMVIESERVWGIGINREEDQVKLYFARINNSADRKMYSLALTNGNFPQSNSEIVELNTLPNNQLTGSAAQYPNVIISDIAFTFNGQRMSFAERGYPHNTVVYGFSRMNTSWIQETLYNTGSQVGDIKRQNSGGGIDYAPYGNRANPSNECDGILWTSSNYFIPRSNSSDRYYGIQGISVEGNMDSDALAPNANVDTDVYIDYNGSYTTSDKETVGDVEVFDCNECLDPCSLNDFIQ